MQNITAGAVVVLKSGGPNMIAWRDDGDKGFLCIWADYDEQKRERLRSGTFVQETLRLVAEAPTCDGGRWSNGA